jgi:outer membrane protein assembly factor BamE (lipoprotein component of BamABCDE complex)
MKIIKANLALVFVIFITIGCAQKRPALDSTTAAQIKKDVSTKAEVSKLLGEPNGVTQKDNAEVWTYTDMKFETDGISYIPVVGMFAGKNEMKSSSIVVTFDEKGIVKELSRMQQSQSMNPFR